MNNRISIGNDVTSRIIFLDKEPLFIKEGYSWKYIQKVGNKTVYSMMRWFDDKYLNIFIDDVLEQIENGINRDNLTLAYLSR